MGLYANLRPVKVLPMLTNGTNLKPEVIKGVDLIVVRELTGGLYYGRPKRRYTTTRGRRAVDSMVYSNRRSPALPGWVLNWPGAAAETDVCR